MRLGRRLDARIGKPQHGSEESLGDPSGEIAVGFAQGAMS